MFTAEAQERVSDSSQKGHAMATMQTGGVALDAR